MSMRKRALFLCCVMAMFGGSGYAKPAGLGWLIKVAKLKKLVKKDRGSDVLDFLLKTEHKTKFRVAKGKSILHYAVEEGAEEVVSSLLSYEKSYDKDNEYKTYKDAIINEENREGETPLLVAARLGKLECAGNLVGKGARISEDVSDEANRDSFMHHAVSWALEDSDLLSKFRYFINRDKIFPAFKYENNLDRTPLDELFSSESKNAYKVLEIIFVRHKDLLRKMDDDEKEKFVNHAIKGGTVPLFKILIEYRAKVNNNDDDSYSDPPLSRVVHEMEGLFRLIMKEYYEDPVAWMPSLDNGTKAFKKIMDERFKGKIEEGDLKEALEKGETVVKELEEEDLEQEAMLFKNKILKPIKNKYKKVGKSKKAFDVEAEMKDMQKGGKFAEEVEEWGGSTEEEWEEEDAGSRGIKMKLSEVEAMDTKRDDGDIGPAY